MVAYPVIVLTMALQLVVEVELVVIPPAEATMPVAQLVAEEELVVTMALGLVVIHVDHDHLGIFCALLLLRMEQELQNHNGYSLICQFFNCI